MEDKLMDNINIENLYQDFLSKIKLPEQMMHPMQKKQVKEAFMGGMAAFILIIMVEFPKHSDEDCEVVLSRIHDELEKYWKKVVTESMPKN